jgi:glycosyltransferase involved in cell wall biosynthesis
MICVTRQLKDRLWWKREHASTIPGCIDLRSFCPRPRDEARAILGWPVKEKVVLFNRGKHPRIKRQDLAEAAVREANKFDPSIKMIVLDGDIDPDAIPLYLNAADCLLITSDWEGSPYIVKEALSCDLPIVSVDVGDVSERIEGVTPSRIVRRDTHALGAAIVGVISLGIRSNGHLAMRDLSEENVAERVRFIYERIVSRDRLVGVDHSSALVKNFRTKQA